VVFHIMLIEAACKYISENYVAQGESPDILCSEFIGVKLLDSSILYAQLDLMGRGGDAAIMQYLQFAAYLILVFATVGIKIFFQVINKDRISLD
jgi:hypothetical protein